MRQKYYVCMDYGLDETGKRVKKYKTYPTLAQARRGLRDFQTEQDTHQTVAPRSMTLDQWLEYWMEEVIQPNRAATTIYGYRKIIDNHLSDALGSVPIQKLTPQHLQQYYSMLMRDKGLSANTVRRHHDLLSCALHMALRQDIILRCPTERVEPPRVIPHEARFYTPAELKRLFGLVEGHWLELIVKLAGSLGLRREEICGLRWSSVDFELRTTLVRELHTAEDLAAMGRWVAGFFPEGRTPRFFLQKFVDSGNLIAGGCHGFSDVEMAALSEILRPFLPRAELRGVE